MVLLILGAVWAAVLVPPALRARAEAHPGDSIGSFHHQLNVLRRTGGYGAQPVHGEFGAVPPPAAPAPRVRPNLAAKRRRDVLVTLLWVMGATLVLGLLPGFRSLLVLHVVADLLCAAYVALLLRMKRTAMERRMRERRSAGAGAADVTPLRRDTPPGVVDLALRRAASR